ncbi:MAG: SelB C-terminal domain-containing protein, partial [Stellaceae bacterium]
TGRKAAIELLEYFDRRGATVRRGDQRRIDPHRLTVLLGELRAGSPG